MKLNLGDFEAVIFDMDGTMVDNTPFHKKAWIEFCKRRGIELSEKDYYTKISGNRNDAIFEVLFGRRVEGDEYTELDEEKEAIYRELYLPELEEVPGLKEFLKQVAHAGLKIGVATTSPYKNRLMILEALELKEFFAVVIGGEDTKHGKPHPEIYLKAAEKLGVEPKKCLAFEDTPSGIKSAKGAGMKVVAVLTSHTKEELNEADYFIKDFTKIEMFKIISF